MPTAQDLGNALLECLREVSSLLEHAHSMAMKQQEALVQNDAEVIAMTAHAQDEVLRRVGEADQRAAAIAGEIAEAAGLEPESVTVESISKATGGLYASLINGEFNRISALSNSLHQMNEINSCLIANGLDIIACCLRTLATDHTATSYGENATKSEAQPYILSLDKLV